jgi:LPXTG-site transpeptidase (sortase) family protein
MNTRISHRLFGIAGIVFLAFVALPSEGSYLKVVSKSVKHTILAKKVTQAVGPVRTVITQTNVGFPLRFKIPTLSIDTTVESVGITPQGTMGAPIDPEPVGWLNSGIRPGEIGAAVIDGHSGWKNGIPAVFDSLSLLHIGDKIYSVDGHGVSTTFIVRSFKTFKPDENAAIVFESFDGKSHLNLITCAGTWDSMKKSHSERLVVFTDKEIL